MARRAIAWLTACGLTSLALVVGASVPTDLAAANKASKAELKSSKRPIQNPKFDPSAVQVDLFEAVDAGQVIVKLIPKDAMGGKVLIENTTDKPLTVKIPDAVIGVSIHAQFANPFGGNQAVGNNQAFGNQGVAGMGQNTQVQGGAVGMNQGQGNPQGNGQLPGNGMMQGNGVGLNLFSIPAEKIVSLPFNSVCLEHGKPEPDSSCKYTLAPVSKFSSDPVLYQLLAAVGTGKVNAQAAQAAAWHLSDKMSFDELAGKTITPVGGFPLTPYFSREQMVIAKQLLAQATERAADREIAESSDQKTKAETATVRQTSLVKSSRAITN